MLVRALRDEVERILTLKVEDPGADLTTSNAAKVIAAMHQLLLTDGI